MKKIVAIIINPQLRNRVARHFSDKQIAFFSGMPTQGELVSAQEVWSSASAPSHVLTQRVRAYTMGLVTPRFFASNKEEDIVAELRQALDHADKDA